jgi:hypothetical protein
MKTWGVNHDQLTFGKMNYASDGSSGGLGFVAGDCNLLAH